MNVKVTINYFYNLIYQFIAIALPILTVPYVSRVLGATQLGNYYYVNAIVTYFGIFAVFGTVDYGQREIAKQQDNLLKRSKIFWEIFYFRIIFVSIALVIYLIFIYNFLLKYQVFFLVSLPSFFSWAIDVSWYFQGVENFKVTALRNGLIKILCTLLIFIFVRKPSDVYIYTFIYSCSTLLGNLTMLPYLRKHEIIYISCKLKDIFNNFKGIMSLFLPVVAIQLYTVLNRIMLGALSNSTQVGYFSQITTVINLAITIISALSAALIPHIANLFENKKLNLMRKYIELSIGYVFMLGVPMIIGCLSVGNIFIPVFFGIKYLPATPILYILSLLFIILGLGQLMGPFLIAINRQRYYTYAVTTTAIVNLFLNFYFLYFTDLKAEGVAIATVIAEFVATTLEGYYLRDLLRKNYFVKYFSRYLLFSIWIFVIVLFIRWLFENKVVILCLSILAAVLFYVCVLILTKDKIFKQFTYPFIKKIIS